MPKFKAYLNDLPIQRKVSAAILLTCGTAVAVMAIGIFLAQLLSFQRTFTRDLETTGAIIGNNSTAAVAFKDSNAAREILTAVRAKSQIAHCAIELPNGSEFAAFNREHRSVPSTATRTDGLHSEGRFLVLNRPILLAGERIGTLHVVSDYQAEYRRSLGLYVVLLGSVLGVSILLALGLSRRLQRLISTPILRLAATAQKVADTKDYSLRAEKLGQDEVGQLTGAFNTMLAKTESADAALRQANQTLEQEIAQHKVAEEALQRSERFIRSLVESLPQNIIRKDLAGRFIFANEFFCKTVGKSMDQIIGKTDFELFPEEMAAKFRRDDEGVVATGQQLEVIEENRNLAGEKVYVQVIKTPLFDAQNQPTGLQVIYWDVSARKQAEEAVEKLHKQLMLASRQAGMAEVATGVLHNVGNVLNSVNVSANVIENRLRQSRVNNIGKALALFREHRADLATFLSEDPKGKILPGYLETLADHLAAEQAEVMNEIDLLNKNVEHIKEIVAMQQNYARLCGVSEMVQISELVEDAIRMNMGAYERHSITLVREFAPVPPVFVDRHKVLQILVNLMRNAKYAMDELGPPIKRLTVSIGLNERGQIVTALRDNGIGIAPENLNRIFGHGFTTKRDGHGFGLHSGALAAKELGGQLTVQSEGVGKGATFCLELPVCQQQPESKKNENHGSTRPVLQR